MHRRLLVLILALASTFLGGLVSYLVLRLFDAIDLQFGGAVVMQADATIFGLAMAGLFSSLLLQLFLNIEQRAQA